MDVDDSMLELACIPDSPGSMQAYLWLKNFFSLLGDYAPDRDNKIELPGIYTKDSIYTIYHKHVTDPHVGGI